MGIEFRELRKHDVMEATAFAAGLGSKVRAQDVNWNKSVVAWNSSKLIACALVARAPLNQDRIHIVSDQDTAGSETVVALMDKVAHKLRAKGTRMTRMVFCQEQNQAAAIAQTHWVDSYQSSLWQTANAPTQTQLATPDLTETQAMVAHLDPGPANDI